MNESLSPSIKASKKKKKHQEAVFDDAALLAYLDAHQLPYKRMARGGEIILGQVQPGSGLALPEIVINKKFKHARLSKLLIAGTITGSGLKSFTAKKLHTIYGDLSLPRAKDVQINDTKDIYGDVDIRGAKTLGAKKIRSWAGQMTADSLEELIAPNAQEIGSVMAPAAVKADLRNLLKSEGSIELDNVTDAKMGSIVHVGNDLVLLNLKKYKNNNLQHVMNNVGLPAAKHVEMNGLVTYGEIFVQSATTLKMDNIGGKGGNIHLHPSLAGTKSGNLMFSKQIWPSHKIDVFNINKELYKTTDKAWKPLQQSIAEITDKHYIPPEKITFVKKCSRTIA